MPMNEAIVRRCVASAIETSKKLHRGLTILYYVLSHDDCYGRQPFLAECVL